MSRPVKYSPTATTKQFKSASNVNPYLEAVAAKAEAADTAVVDTTDRPLGIVSRIGTWKNELISSSQQYQ